MSLGEWRDHLATRSGEFFAAVEGERHLQANSVGRALCALLCIGDAAIAAAGAVVIVSHGEPSGVSSRVTEGITLLALSAAMPALPFIAYIDWRCNRWSWTLMHLGTGAVAGVTLALSLLR